MPEFNQFGVETVRVGDDVFFFAVEYVEGTPVAVRQRQLWSTRDDDPAMMDNMREALHGMAGVIQDLSAKGVTGPVYAEMLLAIFEFVHRVPGPVADYYPDDAPRIAGPTETPALPD